MRQWLPRHMRPRVNDANRSPNPHLPFPSHHPVLSQKVVQEPCNPLVKALLWQVSNGLLLVEVRRTQRSRAKKEEGEARQGNEERRSGKLQDRMSVRKVMVLSRSLSNCLQITKHVLKKLPTPVPSKAESLRSRTKDSSSSRHHTSPSQTEGKDQVRHSPTVPSAPANDVHSQLQGPRPTSKLTSGKRHVLSLLILSILCLMLYKVIFTFTL